MLHYICIPFGAKITRISFHCDISHSRPELHLTQRTAFQLSARRKRVVGVMCVPSLTCDASLDRVISNISTLTPHI